MCVGPGGMATLEIPTYTETALHTLYILYGCFLIHSVHSTTVRQLQEMESWNGQLTKNARVLEKSGFFYIYLDIRNVFFN